MVIRNENLTDSLAQFFLYTPSRRPTASVPNSNHRNTLNVNTFLITFLHRRLRTKSNIEKKKT